MTTMPKLNDIVVKQLGLKDQLLAARRLRLLRKQAKVTQIEVADTLKISRVVYSNYERLSRQIPAEIFIKANNVLVKIIKTQKEKNNEHKQILDQSTDSKEQA